MPRTTELGKPQALLVIVLMYRFISSNCCLERLPESSKLLQSQDVVR
jgi:hypothetical protein